jgi:hypothetical protein
MPDVSLLRQSDPGESSARSQQAARSDERDHRKARRKGSTIRGEKPGESGRIFDALRWAESAASANRWRELVGVHGLEPWSSCV